MIKCEASGTLENVAVVHQGLPQHYRRSDEMGRGVCGPPAVLPQGAPRHVHEFPERETDERGFPQGLELILGGAHQDPNTRQQETRILHQKRRILRIEAAHHRATRCRGLVDTLRHILKLVDLPIDKITSTHSERGTSSFQEDEYGYRREGDAFWNLHRDEFSNFRPAKAMSLSQFFEENVDAALERARIAKPMYEETDRVEAQAMSILGLKQVIWDCGWGIAHYRAGLLALLNLQEHHQEIRDILKDRTLVFGQWTGVSLEGNIILSSAEVRHHWLRFLREVDKQFKFVDWVPHSEKQLSDVLRGMRISHDRLHGRTLAYKYLVQVDKLTKTIQRWLWLNKFPAEIPDNLSQFSLIVENDAGPLMVSHSGELIVPASCPAQLFVDFLVDSLELAEKAMHRHSVNILEEEELHEQVIWKLGLRELSKDETVSSYRMVKCLTALLDESDKLSTSLQDCHIRVSNCYSVLQDGILCIPADLDNP